MITQASQPKPTDTGPVVEQFRPLDLFEAPIHVMLQRAKGEPVFFRLGNRRPMRLFCRSEFGTGLHPATQMAIELIQHVFEKRVPHSALDYGCGTGILGLICSQLGADRIVFADRKASAVRTAISNASRNGMPSTCIPRVVRNATQLGDMRLPLVIANIPARQLIRNVHAFAACLTPGGVLILSGIETSLARRVLCRGRRAGLRVVAARTRGRWTACALVKRDTACSGLGLVSTWRRRFDSLKESCPAKMQACKV
jgi:SAM-dependent methyltransferase